MCRYRAIRSIRKKIFFLIEKLKTNSSLGPLLITKGIGTATIEKLEKNEISDIYSLVDKSTDYFIDIGIDKNKAKLIYEWIQKKK